MHRFNDALDITRQALLRKLDDDGLHADLYALAFLEGDVEQMAQQAGWFEQRADLESEILGLESDTEAYTGHLGKARQLTRRAVDSSKQAQNLESAALYQASAALREALFGYSRTARQQATEALRLTPGSRNAEVETALALAFAGDAERARSLALELAKRFPLHAQIQLYWLPTIQAQLSLARGDPPEAIQRLQPVSPYDLANTMFTQNPSCMYPVYVRGQACLARHEGSAAAAEFQKLLEHRGIVWNCSTGALAHLGLARAYVLQGDQPKARVAYEDFFALWKDADPDIPILKQAKAEYAKLQ